MLSEEENPKNFSVLKEIIWVEIRVSKWKQILYKSDTKQM